MLKVTYLINFGEKCLLKYFRISILKKNKLISTYFIIFFIFDDKMNNYINNTFCEGFTLKKNSLKQVNREDLVCQKGKKC